MNLRATILSLFFIGLLTGCSKETVEIHKFGSIEGTVLDNKSGESIVSASVMTNPGTDAILSDKKGYFSIQGVPTGNYVIQVEKENYESNSVRVAVKEDEVATAQIPLKKKDTESLKKYIKAEVTNTFSSSRNDSSFAEVSYLVTNTSDSRIITEYEVYFKIYTSESGYFTTVTGDSLQSGQQDDGTFTKYINKTSVNKVEVSGIWAGKAKAGRE